MHVASSLRMRAAALVVAAALGASLLLAGCAGEAGGASGASGAEVPSAGDVACSSDVANSGAATGSGGPATEEGPAGSGDLAASEGSSAASRNGNPASHEPERVPLQWNADDAVLVGHQGSTALWGSCGECCIANTLNLVTGSAYSEADIVGFVADRGLCDPETGGMTLDDMADAYTGLLPLDTMDVRGFGGTYAPGPDKMAELLDDGVILNVSVYGAMMREGGHGGEGELHSTHWIVVHEAVRSDDGDLEGFRVIDSASRITYLAAQELEGIYRGRDGTTIVDPACVEVFGWR